MLSLLDLRSASRVPSVALWMLALICIASAIWHLQAAADGVTITRTRVGSAPVTLFEPAGGGPSPVVLIAHGFAGSQQLMQSFALTCARNGYRAVTFDFPGHGHNPRPLRGSITEVEGATRTLVGALDEVARFARGQGDGRLALLGHSMASDIVVRYGNMAPGISAVIAVSMFSPAVAARSPPNLLVITGEWEGPLRREALRAVGLATAPAVPVPGVLYGDFAHGSARKASVSPGTEHVSVLFSRDSQTEALAWLDHSFGIQRSLAPRIDGRGPWILLLLSGVVVLGSRLARWLPRCSVPPAGAGLSWSRLWPVVLLPMLATPLLLRMLPTHFLPVLVADYLVLHFAAYGALTWLCLRRWRAPVPPPPATPHRRGARALAIGACLLFGLIGIVWPIHTWFTCFLPTAPRGLLMLALLLGTLPYFLADAWMTGGIRVAPGARLVSRLALLVSLAIAVALDLERLFFLIIIVPVILLFFLVYGLLERWTYRQTGDPAVGASASACALSWAIGATFPLLSSGLQ